MAAYNEGYRWYVQRRLNSRRVLEKSEWVRKCDAAVQKIDQAVYTDHGILCFRDGNVSNTRLENIVVLHVVDVLMFEFHREATDGDSEADVRIQSTSFDEVPQEMRSSFFDDPDNHSAISFIRKNKDIFFMIFTHWGNFSYVPIRFEVSPFISDIPNAKAVMRNQFWLDVQDGKMQQIRRQMNTPSQKQYYGLD